MTISVESIMFALNQWPVVFGSPTLSPCAESMLHARAMVLAGTFFNEALVLRVGVVLDGTMSTPAQTMLRMQVCGVGCV